MGDEEKKKTLEDRWTAFFWTVVCVLGFFVVIVGISAVLSYSASQKADDALSTAKAVLDSIETRRKVSEARTRAWADRMKLDSLQRVEWEAEQKKKGKANAGH